ncbi:hypothetical protein [Vibrio vulnificus YJ016]|uniref:Uncharacterized protein n=2 Tax=Vibrio vulnificus TaxID=672 RepID=Q7MDL7_VIBVY|nr:hypothetical protein FORC9_3875 [Vibrio vulnificus]ANH65753.1 hypothetical protein FORC16_3870 [Vibrio vulnificus]AXX62237.1 hypothetical protein FORC53_3898 [Vibrio vulnificus]BAC97045.1 hypothetical protein [Vibrio vulnificus YJ016]
MFHSSGLLSVSNQQISIESIKKIEDPDEKAPFVTLLRRKTGARLSAINASYNPNDMVWEFLPRALNS